MPRGVKQSTVWAVIFVIAILSVASRCGEDDTPKEVVRGPTVTATATVTERPAPVVRVIPARSEGCRLAAVDSRKLESALFTYEQYTGGISEVHDLTAIAIADQDIHRLNEAREKFDLYKSNSTAALQSILKVQADLKIHNQMCRDSLRK